MSSIDHIRSRPGSQDGDWSAPMSLEQNLGDLEGRARDFRERSGFAYSILDGDAVIGCVYIYPSRAEGDDAKVRSWVRASRAEMDARVWRSVSAGLIHGRPVLARPSRSRPELTPSGCASPTIQRWVRRWAHDARDRLHRPSRPTDGPGEPGVLG
jgi:hypothetical protein